MFMGSENFIIYCPLSLYSGISSGLLYCHNHMAASSHTEAEAVTEVTSLFHNKFFLYVNMIQIFFLPRKMNW